MYFIVSTLIISGSHQRSELYHHYHDRSKIKTLTHILTKIIHFTKKFNSYVKHLYMHIEGQMEQLFLSLSAQTVFGRCYLKHFERFN